MTDEREQNGDDEREQLTAEQAGERIKAARERDEAAAALEGADELDPAELEALTDEQLLERLPLELRDAIEAGEVPAAVVLEKVRAAGAALAEAPAGEPDPTSAAIAEAHAAYLAAVAEALGPEAEIRPCAACSGYGFNPVELPADHFHERCTDCDGWGNVLSGSRVESQRVLPCQGCNGSGHKPTPQALEQPQRSATNVPVLPVYTPPPPPMEPANVPAPGVVG